ncbi:DUF3102 domain-containing protein [Oceanobacillus sp. FSL K6-0118]|uniref:DUF3102 domain-containing protein n=1 Tax=Oceanobacillus sp. FSL K6-0118 TaxID=2921418 RepID=UPI0030F72748
MAVQNVINMTKEIAEGGGNRLSSDLPTITAEINAYKRIAGEAIFEIGRRLKHVKENDLAHGEFGKWLESVSIDRYEASRYIKVYDEASEGKLGTYTNKRSDYLIVRRPTIKDSTHSISSQRCPKKRAARNIR